MFLSHCLVLIIINHVCFLFQVREALELALEEDLFAKLVFLYRSPETMIKWSRPKDEDAEEQRALPPPPDRWIPTHMDNDWAYDTTLTIRSLYRNIWKRQLKAMRLCANLFRQLKHTRVKYTYMHRYSWYADPESAIQTTFVYLSEICYMLIWEEIVAYTSNVRKR